MSTQNEKPGAMSQAPTAMCQAAGHTVQQPLTRRPLSNEEIDALLPVIQNGWTIRDYATWSIRAAERAHGITFTAAPVAAAPDDGDWHLRGYAYASKQATTCAGCGEHKHTPLRIDAMGGYVCLTCIDQKLGSLLGEFGYAPAAPGIDLAYKVLDFVIRNGAITRNSPIAKEARELIDASPKGGSTDSEPKIWGTQKPGSMPKLFGAHYIAELNWYPDEGYDLVCMQVIERVQATSAEAGEEQCESGSPDCGPVEHWDSEAVPLCARCWKELTNSQSPGVSE